MQLALFTPGAYLWPVYRNFESFIAALGTPGCDALDIATSPLYPARLRTDSAVHGFSIAMDTRLTELHRELYGALLRPSGYFRGESRTFADLFWPDLRHTAVDALFEALAYNFMLRDLTDIDVPTGLALLRAVFFNHEAAEPELWLSATLARLTPERRPLPLHTGSIDAPPAARLDNLAFCLHAGTTRPSVSAGWVRGKIERQFDGRLRVDYTCGLDPALLGDEARYAALRGRIDNAVAQQLHQLFGWREARAA